MTTRSDLVIVGAGPAGLATALEAVRHGLSATVIDRSQPPIDKPCGEGLLPAAVEGLLRLEVTIAPTDAFPISGIRYIDGEIEAVGRFAAPALGMRRWRLHRGMVERATAVGVKIAWGVSARGLVSRGVESDGGLFPGRWLIGADGLASQVRRWGGFELDSTEPLRCGMRQHFALAPWSHEVEVHFGPGCEAYVTPVAREEVGIALLWDGSKTDFDTLLARFPALAARVAGRERRSPVQGVAGFDRRVNGVVRGNLALVGDASGYRDALVGDGVALALAEAEALVSALVAGDLESYESAHERIVRRSRWLTRALLWLARRPEKRRRVLEALADDPDLFDRLLDALSGVGTPPLSSLLPFLSLLNRAFRAMPAR